MSTERPDAETALARLMEGNARFVAGRPIHPHDDPARRRELGAGQHPFAAILACADSRVVPELIFDQGLGDLFVIRVAGNLLDDAILGSLEYAVGHLGVELVCVLGHSNCGAVGAALSGDETNDHIDSLVRAIRPAVEHARAAGGDLLDGAVRANARIVADAIRASEPVMTRRVAAGRLAVIAARYDLVSGEVERLDD